MYVLYPKKRKSHDVNEMRKNRNKCSEAKEDKPGGSKCFYGRFFVISESLR